MARAFAMDPANTEGEAFSLLHRFRNAAEPLHFRISHIPPPPPLPRRIAGCLTPGASFANLMAVVAARHKHFPHIRQKGLQPVSTHRAEGVNF